MDVVGADCLRREGPLPQAEEKTKKNHRKRDPRKNGENNLQPRQEISKGGGHELIKLRGDVFVRRGSIDSMAGALRERRGRLGMRKNG